MRIQEPEQLRSWQAAHRFKLEVYRLVKSKVSALRDYRYRAQVRDAASDVESDIAEGFRRYYPGMICLFLTYALASLEETTTRVKDGVDRGHFTAPEIGHSLRLGEDCRRYMKNWWDSLQPLLPPEKRGPFRPQIRPGRKRPRTPEDSSNSQNS